MLNLKLIIPKFSLLLHNTLSYFLKILTFCSKSEKIESFSLFSFKKWYTKIQTKTKGE